MSAAITADIRGPETSSIESHASDPTRSVPQFGQDFNEFSYKPVPVVSAVGLILAILSSVGIVMWMALPLTVVAGVLSLTGLWITRRSLGAYGGSRVGWTGLVLSVLILAAGIAYQIYTYQTEVPEGYQRISFVNDISEKQFVEQNGQATVHPDVLGLDGKKIFTKGYIYQTGQMFDLKSFLFVKDNASCCFGANPALWDRIGVTMADGKGIDYKAGKVAVAGTFHLNPHYDPSDDKAPIYIIECEKFTTKVSDF